MISWRLRSPHPQFEDQMHHSYSALKMYDQCPAQYHEVKILRLHPFRSTPATEFGVRAHSAMEAAVKFKTPLPSEFTMRPSPM